MYEKNVYISKISIQNLKITDRMIEDVIKNRNEIYREAALLLKKYKKIMNLEKIDLKELFENTFIEISDENTLFELYWIIKIIKASAQEYKMYIIDDRSNKVAEWEDERYLYTIYHNSTGSDQLLFNIKLDEVKESKNEYLKQLTNVFECFYNIKSELWESGEDTERNIWSGRPDILIEIRDKESREMKKLVIGEVKYTDSKEYMLEGLKQLLEYIYFVKERSGNYFSNNIPINGLLFVDNVQFNQPKSNLIRIFSTNSNKKPII